MTVALDSWAILRFLDDSGPAAGKVAELLDHDHPVVSWINLGEVYYIVCRATDDQMAAGTVRDLRRVTRAELPDQRRIVQAARIRASHAMSYADAFAAATARAHDAELWTGDPELLVHDAPWRWRDLRQD